MLGDMHVSWAAGMAFLPSTLALTFGTLPRRVSIGQTTEITWTNDIADPPVWVLQVVNRNGESAATVDTVEGSVGQFSFSFPAVEGSQSFLALQALSEDKVLATSAPFRVTLDEAGVSSFVSPPLPATSSTLSSVSSIFQAGPSATPPSQIISSAPYYTSLIIPPASPSAQMESNSASTPALNLPLLIAGPIIATAATNG
ncbi:hypothetical protein K438DRAFT_1987121 [Mycena galopus ATCC 62051]|nr:hypothetical protein K438DRAFT_1987121 [Mycena galopus ATCC 62051]